MCRNGILAIALAVLLASVAHASPSQMTVQGRLTDPGGTPLPAGAKTFTFRIFNASIGGSQVWPGGGGEIQSITSGADGLWVGLLGAVDPLNDLVFADSVRWLEINVDGTTLPRVRLVTGPYAYRVSTIDGASGGTITSKVSIGPGHTNTGADGFVAGNDNDLAGDYSTISGGALNTTASGSATVAGGQQNNATGFASSIAGGASNDATSTYSAVAGGYNNSSTNSWSVVGGGFNNTADDEGATVGGGRYNNARGQYSTVAGGGGMALTDSNTAGGNYSSIGGGFGNVASGHGSNVDGGHYNIASGLYSTIGGGQFNDAQGTLSTIAGGGNTNIFNGQNIAQGYATVISGGTANRAVDNYSTIGGGLNSQTRGQYSTLGGGKSNLTDGDYATVSGGNFNTAAGYGSTVGGGSQNYTPVPGALVAGGDTNSAQGFYSVIGGGILNNASGTESVIDGGRGNTATGTYATIGGGWTNAASGLESTIGGGRENQAGGGQTTVGGGYDNIATGIGSTVPGGVNNDATGDYSFAAGVNAKAVHANSFVWNDAYSFTRSSTAASQFLINAQSGVGINTETPGKALHIGDNNRVGSQGMIRLESRSSTGSAEYREWEIGVPQTGAVSSGKGYDFVIDDVNLGPDPEAVFQWGSGYLGLGMLDPVFRLDLPNVANASGQGRANAWTTYSSRRWKKNITPIEGAIDKVLKLNGVEYDNTSDGAHSIGLIAEDVGKVIPEVVQYEANGVDAAALDYARLVALLIEAVKSQQFTIETQHDRIAKLEKKLEQ